MAYQNRSLKMGLSANRLYTAWFEKDSTRNIANYYSGFVQGIIPLNAVRSVIEPYVAYRKWNENSNILDIGVYYTYDIYCRPNQKKVKGQIYRPKKWGPQP